MSEILAWLFMGNVGCGRRPSIRFIRRGAGRGGAIGGPSEKKGKTSSGREVLQEGRQCCPSIGGVHSGPLPYGPPSSARGNPNSQWNWVPGHYVPPPGSQVPSPWIAGPPAWEQASWQPVASGVRPSAPTWNMERRQVKETQTPATHPSPPLLQTSHWPRWSFKLVLDYWCWTPPRYRPQRRMQPCLQRNPRWDHRLTPFHPCQCQTDQPTLRKLQWRTPQK